ncbi:hypothetical protein IWW37_006056, partial [Coemansia sp. RSA 2050]
PLDPERRSLVQDIASEAAQFLESYLAAEPAANQGESAAAMDGTAELHPDSPMQAPGSMATPQAGTTLENSALLREKLGLAKRWLLWQSINDEKDMYKSIRALGEFVALVVKGRLGSSAEANSSSGLGRRLVLPSSKSDFKPIDADDKMRIDMGLTCAKPDSKARALRGQVSYYELLAVIEAKVKDGNSGFEQAFKQLIVYTRQMFQQQHNLRFAWGITASGRDARVCHFGPDKAVSSRPMSVATADGRRAFIEVLVNWSFCEKSQLGHDSTMEYMSDLKCWQIACPDDAGSTGGGARTAYYYFTTVNCHADRVFGRHTRCFLATDEKPTDAVSLEKPLIPKVVIKDSWAFAKPNAADDTRDEVETLKKIRRGLSGNKDCHDIIVPEIIVGGRVSFQLNGSWVEDNTTTMYQLCEAGDIASAQYQLGETEDTTGEQCQPGKVGNGMDQLYKQSEAPSSSDSTFRAHRRIVMTPIGEPLRSTRSVAEFVTVVCDAMRSHSAIVKHCGILHRDISDNNVLVYRANNGIARGVLIDFDYAIEVKPGSRENRKEMTGTFPFMSINNLMTSDVERTSLDDWESMVCLICLYATLGTVSGKRRTYEDLAGFPIRFWRDDSLEMVLNFKRLHLSESTIFMEEIVEFFKADDDKDGLLKNLAVLIHELLFQNPTLGSNYHGTSRKLAKPKLPELSFSERLKASKHHESGAQPSGGRSTINPFVERAKEWERISQDLLGLTNDCWELAIEYQEAEIKEKSSVVMDNNSK